MKENKGISQKLRDLPLHLQESMSLFAASTAPNRGAYTLSREDKDNGEPLLWRDIDSYLNELGLDVANNEEDKGVWRWLMGPELPLENVGTDEALKEKRDEKIKLSKLRQLDRIYKVLTVVIKGCKFGDPLSPLAGEEEILRDGEKIVPTEDQYASLLRLLPLLDTVNIDDRDSIIGNGVRLFLLRRQLSIQCHKDPATAARTVDSPLKRLLPPQLSKWNRAKGLAYGLLMGLFIPLLGVLIFFALGAFFSAFIKPTMIISGIVITTQLWTLICAAALYVATLLITLAACLILGIVGSERAKGLSKWFLNIILLAPFQLLFFPFFMFRTAYLGYQEGNPNRLSGLMEREAGLFSAIWEDFSLKMLFDTAAFRACVYPMTPTDPRNIVELATNYKRACQDIAQNLNSIADHSIQAGMPLSSVLTKLGADKEAKVEMNLEHERDEDENQPLIVRDSEGNPSDSEGALSISYVALDEKDDNKQEKREEKEEEHHADKGYKPFF